MIKKSLANQIKNSVSGTLPNIHQGLGLKFWYIY